jgi:hypothetical protein
MNSTRHVVGFASILLGASGLLAQTNPPSPATIAAVQAAAGAAAASAQATAGGAAVAPTVASGGPSAAVTLLPPGGAAPISGTIATPRPLTPTVPAGLPTQARLVNLSTRGRVSTSSPLISGFVISGTDPRPVLVRGAGPALTGFGVAGALAAPRLELHGTNDTVIATNTGWNNAPELSAAFAKAGAFPFARDSADSAVVALLPPGAYTVQVADAAGNGGVALAEVYDLDGPNEASRLSNVSTRATVAPAGGELISGFVLAGTVARQFLVRGVGPTLGKLGVSGALDNPTVSLFDSAGQQVAGNDNWSGGAIIGGASSATGAVATGPVTPVQFANDIENATEVTTASSEVGAFPLDQFSTDAAFVVTLSPGVYTVQVRGVGQYMQSAPTVVSSSTGTSGSATAAAQVTAAAAGTFLPAAPGVALLEIYELP